jgi:general secretion pathway protein K
MGHHARGRELTLMNGLLQRMKGGHGGSALLVVVLMLGVIAVLVTIVSHSVSSAAMEMSASRRNLEAQSDLRSGIELGVAAILNFGDGVRDADVETELHGRRITVRMTNERARIDLNLAPAKMIAGLLRANGVDDNEASSLAANVIEWRGGAKSQAPMQAGDGNAWDESHFDAVFKTATNAGLKDAPVATAEIKFFFHPSQLLSVPGFSEALVKAILPSLTVANGTNQVDPFIAEAGVLNALPDSSENKVQSFLKARDGNVGHDTAIQMLGVDKRLLTDDASRGWRLRITTQRRAVRPRYSEAVVVLAKDGVRPYRILYVVDDAGQAPL